LLLKEGCLQNRPEIFIREIASDVDHNHCTTRQFQHMTFEHDGIWFVFYSDGKDFIYQISANAGKSWQLADKPIDRAPNGSSSFDLIKIRDRVFISHAFYPLGRYDVNAPYATDQNRRGEYIHEGRIKEGQIKGQRIHWQMDINPGFTPDYSNIVHDSNGYFWIFSREDEQGVAYRSMKPNDVKDWMAPQLCMPPKGRHAMDAAVLDDGDLYVVSMLTTDGKLYGNYYNGREWGNEGILLDNNVTAVAGDDRRLSIEFDPTVKQLHLVYVDSESVLRYRVLSAPYKPDNWFPELSQPGLNLGSDIFTCALSVDKSKKPYDLMIAYGLEKHTGQDKRERTGELFIRRFAKNQWNGDALLMSQPGSIYNWYPNVNQDISKGICMIYSRSVNEFSISKPLAVMVSMYPFK
jgi:hypothetical protein